MAEGRRHSVDVPISKTLVALKRVRSLRDPDTNSMPKFNAVVDNMKWEVSSRGSALLDFSIPEKRDECDSVLDGNLGALIPNAAKRKELTTLKGQGKTRSKAVHELCRDHIQKPFDSTSALHPDNLLEEVGSCYSQGFELLDRVNANAETLVKRSRYDITRMRHAAVEDAVMSRVGSPCMSGCEALRKGSSRCALGIPTEEVDIAGSNFSGCGISYCWSRTPKCSDPNLASDTEEEYPLLSAEGRGMVYRDISLYPETPRSLSQKFRPKAFNDLVGLSVVVKSLAYAVAKGKVAPMYLFHGPRGTGKTSAARIFAAALNCLSLEEQRPCGFCQECVFQFSGRSRDVKELDAAKMNHKDRIKALLRSASLAPFSSSFKVFIIDECQSLQGELWSAILSSPEEIFRHSVFVMVTSDVDKLPHGCASRCQRYHFPKIKESDVVCRLQKLCIEEGLEFDSDALEFIAQKSNGSLRDAETMLDQLALLGKKITVSLTNELIGVVSDDELLDLLGLALSSDTANTVRRARELMGSRVDPMQLISQLADLIMDILAGKRPSGFVEAGGNSFGRRSLSVMDLHILRHALKVLSETEKQLRTSKNQATWLTAALLQFGSGESSLMDMNDFKGYPRDSWVQSAASLGESFQNYVCYVCNNKKSNCVGRHCNKAKLDNIWRRAIGNCDTSSVKRFLLKEGHLSSIYINEGFAIVEVEFYHPDHVSRAEKLRILIVELLQFVLGCNLDIRIKFLPVSIRKNAKMKKPSCGLLGCSGRKQEMSDAANTADENETKASVTRKTFDGPCPSQNRHLSSSLQRFDAKTMQKSRNFSDRTATLRNLEDDVGLTGTNKSRNLVQDKLVNGCKIEANFSHEVEEVSQHFNVQEPDIQSSCFAKMLKLQRKFSTDVAHTICLRVQPHDRFELSDSKKTASTTYLCSYNTYSPCSRTNTEAISSSEAEIIYGANTTELTRLNEICDNRRCHYQVKDQGSAQNIFVGRLRNRSMERYYDANQNKCRKMEVGIN